MKKLQFFLPKILTKKDELEEKSRSGEVREFQNYDLLFEVLKVKFLTQKNLG